LRILIVSPWLPHPKIAHAGGQHLFHTVRSLSVRGHGVHLLCYGRGEPDSQMAALSAHCEQLRVVRPAHTWRQKADQVLAGGWRRPWMWGRRTHAEVHALIWSTCAQQRIDAVHFAWTEMGRYLEAVPDGVGAALGTMDVEYLVRPREVRLYPWRWSRVRAAHRARRLIRGEQRYLRLAHVTLACSTADRRHLARLGDVDRIHVVPPWVDLDGGCVSGLGAAVQGRLTFMGAMDRIANQAAVRFLLGDVWPLVKEGYPAATLHVVGANPPRWLRQRADGDPRLFVTGYVEDLAAEWAKTDIAVSPSLTGGGMMTKVAQPMAAGLPVVTTTLGNEGVAAPLGEAIEVGDDGPSFARAVLELLVNRERRRRLAAAGQRHVLETLDWASSIANLEAAYADALGRAKQDA
jgi:glycosyltransferase involved in cell wall biosynthesis